MSYNTMAGFVAAEGENHSFVGAQWWIAAHRGSAKQETDIGDMVTRNVVGIPLTDGRSSP
jgi:hypothetical protein